VLLFSYFIVVFQEISTYCFCCADSCMYGESESQSILTRYFTSHDVCQSTRYRVDLETASNTTRYQGIQIRPHRHIVDGGLQVLTYTKMIGSNSHCDTNRRRTPPSSEALRHSGGARRRCTSATVTLYLDVELRSDKRPGTEQNRSVCAISPPPTDQSFSDFFTLTVQ